MVRLALALLIGAQLAEAPPASAGLDPEALGRLDEVVLRSIEANETPGAVVLVARKGHVAYRKAFGRRAVLPQEEAMTVDTVFDMASLTKVLAGTACLMKLLEQGKVRLQDDVIRYIPEFRTHGKQEITVEQLLSHHSGLRPDLDLDEPWYGYDTALQRAYQEHLQAAPGERFIYSDINFILVAEIVRRVSGERIDSFAARNIYQPLGMSHTTYNPPKAWWPRVAPSDWKEGRILRGEVHDPTAYRMFGVSGHAGLFSTADDVALFAQMILNGGQLRGVRIFSPFTVVAMTTPQSPSGSRDVRGLGWDIDSRFSSLRGDLFPRGSFGHTGFTGTSLWIDPTTETFVILLTNRLHPDGKGDVVPLRSKVANVVAASIREVASEELRERALAWRAPGPAADDRSGRGLHPVANGIDVLAKSGFAPLQGKRVGLITNQTGLDREGRSSIDLLSSAAGIRLVALFSPEHGIQGIADTKVASSRDEKTGLPIHSLYGDALRPTPEMLQGIDALVFDIQDIGTRFYTYITTLGYALEEAGRHRVEFFVLDRPNPINGHSVEGPLLGRDKLGFTGYFPLPIRHGMTTGELAKLFNQENKIGARLTVVPMEGWRRQDWYDQTGLLWVNPSPNMRNLNEALLYPGVGTLETTNLSVGRGTDTPFEVLGAPWIDARKLSADLNLRGIPGVRFTPTEFTPRSSVYMGQRCQGILITITDRERLEPVRVGVEIAELLHRLYPAQFEIEKYLKLMGSEEVLNRIREGWDPVQIVRSWQEDLRRFQALRRKYLLY
ncbi:MAG: DUF1343 domain-containing protein [Acidobacteria bacterium]|nr:DUF1343 domain-containing protein [Acidobacteriota bacterium]